MTETLLDAFIDSLKIFAVVALCTYIIALIEPLLANKIKLKGNLAPLIGVSVSLLPQCGFSVVATDLYQKRHITLGTLIGVYLATSDEALPIFLSYPEKALHILPILALKFAFGLIFAYLIDFISVKNKKEVVHHIEHCKDEYKIRLMHCDSAELSSSSAVSKECDCVDCITSPCRHSHQIQEKTKTQIGILNEYSDKFSKKQTKRKNIDRFLLKPLYHSVEIFLFVLVINIIFGIILYFVGEDRIISFLLANKYIAPLISVIVGMIPNCASSIIISELYIMGGLGFGATLGGLCMNAGLGFIILFKDTKHKIGNISIIALMFCISIFISYMFSIIFSFDTLKF